MSKTFIINYQGLQTGGIEVSLAYIIKYAQERNYRVIWITMEDSVKKAKFSDIVDYDRVEKIILKSWEYNFLVLPKLNLLPDEEVVMFSIGLLRFITQDEIRKIYNVKSFTNLYFIAHFEGNEHFPERAFKNNILKEFWNKRLSVIVEKTDKGEALRAFSMKHLDVYEEVYNIKIDNKKKKLLGKSVPVPEMNVEKIEKKSKNRNECFKIVACSRFDFPHKGFLVGLIGEFARIKQQYPQATLDIIGYGEGIERLQEEVGKLNEDAAASIAFSGEKKLEEMLEIYRESHLVISLAGAASHAASVAVPTLLMRHNTYSCETYGFYKDSPDKVLSEDEGVSILPYIGELIECDSDTYKNHSIKTRDVYLGRIKDYNPGYVFNQPVQSAFLNKTDVFLAYICNFMGIIPEYVKQIPIKIKKIIKSFIKATFDFRK